MRPEVAPPSFTRPFSFLSPHASVLCSRGGGGGPVRRVGPRECVGPGVVGLIREQGAGFRGRDVLSFGHRGELASVLWWGGPPKYLNQTTHQPHPGRSRGGDRIASTRWLFLRNCHPGEPRDTFPARYPEPPPLQSHRPIVHRQPSGQGGLDLPFDWSRRLFTKEGSELGGGVSSRSSFWASGGRREFGACPGNVAIVKSPDHVTNSLYDLERLLISGHKFLDL